MDDVLVQSEVHEPEGSYTPAPYPPDSGSAVAAASFSVGDRVTGLYNNGPSSA